MTTAGIQGTTGCKSRWLYASTFLHNVPRCQQHPGSTWAFFFVSFVKSLLNNCIQKAVLLRVGVELLVLNTHS